MLCVSINNTVSSQEGEEVIATVEVATLTFFTKFITETFLLLANI